MIALNVPITTKRTQIRKFRPDDREPFLAFMLEPDNMRFLAFPEGVKTEVGASELLDQVIAAYDSEEPIHSYAIAHSSNDEYLGSCGLSPYPGGGCEIYFALNPAHRGQGYATEAMDALLASLPDDTVVRAFCHPDNHDAHAVAERLGLVSRGEHLHAQFGTTGRLFVRPATSRPGTSG